MSTRNAQKRAAEMLKIAAKYITTYHDDGLIHYDGTECDGICLAEDCEAAAEALEQPYPHLVAMEEIGGVVASIMDDAVRDVKTDIADKLIVLIETGWQTTIGQDGDEYLATARRKGNNWQTFIAEGRASSLTEALKIAGEKAQEINRSINHGR